MEDFILDILARIRELERALAANELEDIVRTHNQGIRDNTSHISKRRALPFFLKVRESDPQRWNSWNISPNEDALLLQTLRLKPRRTASGVATITVITKPWLCSGACIYCPNDVRMPKSYLHNEPACQRAERNCFDPYLQVSSRLRALESMGHVTDKIELIVLGGTWNDYPESYRIWFVRELFRALNDAEEHGSAHDRNGRSDNGNDENAAANGSDRCTAAHDFAHQNEAERRTFYDEAGISHNPETLAQACAKAQQRVYEGKESHAQAIRELYGENHPWQHVSTMQTATLDDVFREHRRNVNAAHRNVGLVIETRPDSINCESLALMRALGCTKIQMGVQSLNEHVLEANKRHTSPEQIAQAFALCRLFGFKSHAHFMANLLGATPGGDASDFRTLVSDKRFLPDEVKMYPCALVDGTGLVEHWQNGTWKPYTERELIDVLVANMQATPPYVRVSRMIRDISAHDIMTGNKKVNLRQLVDLELAKRAQPVQEIRSREIAFGAASSDELSLSEIAYETTNTHEVFLQWVTPDNRIAGFLRLSMPNADYVNAHAADLPINAGEAMIREVHVYGRVAGLHQGGENAQHRGLGRMLIERACDIARENGYTAINVISAIGTRGYYRARGFADNGLYQQRSL